MYGIEPRNMLFRTQTSLSEAEGNMLRVRYRKRSESPARSWAADRTKSGVAATMRCRVTNGYAMCSRAIAKKLHKAHQLQRGVRLGSTQSVPNRYLSHPS